MAQRLATEYVKTCLELSEAEMKQLVRMFHDHQVTLQVKVLDNGSQEVVITEDGGEEVVLSFERRADTFICTGSCRVCSPHLANVLRKVVSAFKGSAIVNRIYSHFTMVYYYNRGSVVKIMERKNGRESVVYEYKDTIGEMERLYRRDRVERDIGNVQMQINELLDLRNESEHPLIIRNIDERLTLLSHKLFVLEA
jgi:hypothetical protein